MKSIIDITWAAPKIECGMVVITYGMHVVVDTDTEDVNDFGQVFFVSSSIQLLPKTVASGQANIEKVLRQCVDSQRDDYGPISIGRFRDSAVEMSRKVDLSALVHPAWAQSEPYHYTAN